MARGFKKGGRTKGTPKRATTDVEAKLAALDCNPIEGMARIATDLANAPELRGRMFAELAGYVAPKRKAIEHTADITTSILGAPTIEYDKLSSDTLKRLYDAQLPRHGDTQAVFGRDEMIETHRILAEIDPHPVDLTAELDVLCSIVGA